MNQFKTLTINGNTYTVKDPQAAKIDDGKVGEDTWSSRKIIETLCPAFTKEGTVVSCQPVEGYPLSVTTQVEEASTVSLVHTGKNLFDGHWEPGRLNTSTGGDQNDGNSIRTGYIPIIPGQSYYFALGDNTNNYPILYDENKGFVRYPGLKWGNFSFKAGETEYYIRVAQFDKKEPYALAQLELGTTPSEYAPYTGNVYVETLPGAGVYAWHTGQFTDESGEVIQLRDPVDIASYAGVNVLHCCGDDMVVNGRSNIGVLLQQG